MSDLIARLRDKARLRAAHGLTGWVLAEEALLAQAADEIERLTAERDELRRQLAEAYTRASEVARTLTTNENGHARLVDPSGWIAETILGLTRPAEESNG